MNSPAPPLAASDMIQLSAHVLVSYDWSAYQQLMITLIRPIAAIARKGTERSSERAWNHVTLRHAAPIAPGLDGTITRARTGATDTTGVDTTSARFTLRLRRGESFSSFTTRNARAMSNSEIPPHTSLLVSR